MVRGADGRATPRRRRNRPAPLNRRRAVAQIPGLQRATFRGGYTVSVMKADIATGEAKEVWHNQPNDALVNAFTNLRLAGDYVIFPFNVGGGRGGRGARGATATPPPPSGPIDEWERYYSLNIASPDSRARCCSRPPTG